MSTTKVLERQQLPTKVFSGTLTTFHHLIWSFQFYIEHITEVLHLAVEATNLELFIQKKKKKNVLKRHGFFDKRNTY